MKSMACSRNRCRWCRARAIDRDKGILPSMVALLMFWLGLGSVQAQAFANPVLGSNSALPTVTKEVQEVSLILTVTNHRGHFVRNLTPSDLSIRDIRDNNQAPERITYFQTETDLPLRVALVVDTSDSVTYRFRFEQRAAAAFLRHILRPESDRALIVGFNQEVHIAQRPTADSDLLAQTIGDLHLGGETAIYDAVRAAAQELMKIKDTQPCRRAIVLITDGEDNRSHMGVEAAIESALRADSIVYVLSTNRDIDIVEGDKAMKQLAEATGGRLLRAQEDGDVRRAFSTIGEELRSQYAIAYKPVSQRHDGLFHRLIVEGPKKLRIYHRLGYFAK